QRPGQEGGADPQPSEGRFHHSGGGQGAADQVFHQRNRLAADHRAAGGREREPAEPDRYRTQRGVGVLPGRAAEEGLGVPDQLWGRERTAAGLHRERAAADRGAEPVAGIVWGERDPSGTGADDGRAAGHGAVRRDLPGGGREAEGRGGAQGDRGDHRWGGPGKPEDEEPGDRGCAEIRRGDLQYRLLRPGGVWLRVWVWRRRGRSRTAEDERRDGRASVQGRSQTHARAGVQRAAGRNAQPVLDRVYADQRSEGRGIPAPGGTVGEQGFEGAGPQGVLRDQAGREMRRGAMEAPIRAANVTSWEETIIGGR